MKEKFGFIATSFLNHFQYRDSIDKTLLFENEPYRIIVAKNADNQVSRICFYGTEGILEYGFDTNEQIVDGDCTKIFELIYTLDAFLIKEIAKTKIKLSVLSNGKPLFLYTKAEKIHSLLEKRNDAKILFRLFEDSKYDHRVKRIDAFLKSVSLENQPL